MRAPRRQDRQVASPEVDRLATALDLQPALTLQHHVEGTGVPARHAKPHGAAMTERHSTEESIRKSRSSSLATSPSANRATVFLTASLQTRSSRPTRRARGG